MAYALTMSAIDLNSDLGESFGIWRLGDDEAMLEVVTSANVACGFHAGDPSTLRRVCTAAVANGVAVGAQVAYPDLVGFGRRYLDIDPIELRDAVLYQLGALDAFAQVAGAEVAYVKPHGALYHATIDDADQADAVVAAAAEYDPSLAVLGAPGSQLLRAAERRRPRTGAGGVRRPGLPPRRPARAAPRARRACSSTPAEVAVRAVRLATEREVRRRRRHGRRRRRPLAVRARRHAGRGGHRPGRARRARRGRRRRPPVHRLTHVPAVQLADTGRRPGWSSSTAAPMSVGGVRQPRSEAGRGGRRRGRAGGGDRARDPGRPVPTGSPSPTGSRALRARPGGRDRTATVVEIEVVYDGDDLAEVAGATRARPSPTWSPATPRRPTAARSAASPPASPTSPASTRRSTSPGGRRRARGCRPARSPSPPSTAAVYPTASPGGWHLLGRTDVRMWDVDRDPPALITPGHARALRRHGEVRHTARQVRRRRFVPGLEGVVAFESEIAEPDRDGGSLRYRGVDIEDLVGSVTFGNVWALLVDGRFGPGLPPAEPFPIPVHTGDVRVDVQAALAMVSPLWGYRPLLDIDRRGGPRATRPRRRDGPVVRRPVGTRHRHPCRAAGTRSTSAGRSSSGS